MEVTQVTQFCRRYMPSKPIGEHEMPINPPVFRGVESKNQFNPNPDPKPRPSAPISGPVLPVESSNTYIPMEEPRVDAGKMMAPPTFRGINIERSNQVLNSLKNT